MRDPAAVTLAELVAWCASQGLGVLPAASEARLEREVEGLLGLDEVVELVRAREALPAARLVVAPAAASVEALDDRDAAAALAHALGRARTAGLLVRRGVELPDRLRRALDEQGITLVLADEEPSVVAVRIDAWLDERRGPSETVHGTLADVFDVGLLVVGESGVGKSEAVLELVLRGHRLVADDAVELRRAGGRLVGTPPELSRHHLEVRGLGILNLADLLGPAAVQARTHIGLVAELVHWDEATRVDRLGVEERIRTYLGVDVPEIQVPVSPGRNLGAILEIAVRNQLLKNQGRHTGIRFERRVLRAIAQGDEPWKA